MSDAEPRLVVTPKDLTAIRLEWDEIAATRARQIDDREDSSFHYVLLPCIDQLLGDSPSRRVLDAGCGTGYLTEHLAKHSEEVVGVDLSPSSIGLARTRHPASNATYECSSVEQYATAALEHSFDVVVANMMLMTTPSVASSVDAFSRLLRGGGRLICTVTHPWFWPRYWGYEEAPWFIYERELAIEAPFRISAERTSLTTTHWHRPLALYTEVLRTAGFVLERLREPEPVGGAPDNYTISWTFPRFLAFEFRI